MSKVLTGVRQKLAIAIFTTSSFLMFFNQPVFAKGLVCSEVYAAQVKGPELVGLTKESVLGILTEAANKSADFDNILFLINNNLETLSISASTESESWTKPVIIAGKGASTGQILTLYRGHLFVGNYFKSVFNQRSDENTPGKSLNLNQARGGQKAIELRARGKWSLVDNAPKRMLRLLTEAYGPVVTLYRGASKFEYEVSMLLKKNLQKEPDAPVSREDVVSLKQIIEAWSKDPRYLHVDYANDHFVFPIWKNLMAQLESQSVSNSQFIEAVQDAFSSEYVTVNDQGRQKVVNHKSGIFTTPNKEAAFMWGFDRVDKIESGAVLVYKVDLTGLSAEQIASLYAGIEANYVEVAFFGNTGKVLALKSMEETPLDKDQDPRKKAEWKKHQEEWNDQINTPPDIPVRPIWD